MRLKSKVAPVLLALLLGSLFIQLPLAIASRADDYEWFDPIVIVRGLLLENFVEKPDAPTLQRMQEATIGAMVGSLRDPYTEFVPASRMADFDKQLRGTYVGIGAEIDIVNDYLTIVTPMDDSPALEAGVMAGDTVLEIEGESTRGKSAEECIAILTGEPGTQVTIKVRRVTGEEELLTITRRRIVTHTVKGMRRIGEAWDYRIDPEMGVGYIRITQFVSTTTEDTAKALSELAKQDLKGLILDVRFDPGGELDAAVAIADMFLESGRVVSIKARNDERVYEATAPGTLTGFPIVVLVNETSASASEILAGALQDNGRAKVLGERTYGKGSVQEVRILPNRMGQLKMTAAYYHLPSGRNLHRKPDSTMWGVDPDDGFRVPMTNDQYRAMIQARRQYEVINRPVNGDQKWNDPAWIENEVKDIQLARALTAIQTNLRTGTWPRVGEATGDLAALDDEFEQAIEFRNRLAAQLEEADKRVREMRQRAEEAGRERLVPSDADTAGAVITVTDASGRVIGAYRVRPGGDVEQALAVARVEKIER